MLEGKRAGLWDVTPCILIDGNVATNLLPQYTTLIMEAGYVFETSINTNQNKWRSFPEGSDINIAVRRRRFEDIPQAILKK